MRRRGHRSRCDAQQLGDLALREAEHVARDDDGSLSLGEATQLDEQIDLSLPVVPDGAAPAGMLDSMHAAGGRSMRE